MSPPARWNLVGDNFRHTSGGHTGRCGTHGKLPREIEWCFRGEADVTFHLDFHLLDPPPDPAGRRFGWLLESRSIRPRLYQRVAGAPERVLAPFEAVFTHDRELLALDPRFRWCPVNGTWIRELGVPPKTKLVSAISSSKRMSAGHRARLAFIERYRERFDLFGNTFHHLPRKELGLADYRFSVAIENGSYRTYFTEKLLDCFATGTIPIYLGAPDIAEHFDANGILFIDPDGSFDFDALCEELYVARLDAVRENFERVARDYHCAEDWIYRTYRDEFGF